MDLPSVVQATSPISCPSSSVIAVSLRPLKSGAAATHKLFAPRSFMSHATFPPEGAAVIADEKGAFKYWSIVAAAPAHARVKARRANLIPRFSHNRQSLILGRSPFRVVNHQHFDQALLCDEL